MRRELHQEILWMVIAFRSTRFNNDRLYGDLVEKEEACQLDRFQSSEKSGRRIWLWSCLIAQPSTRSPVKGLYLYGGVRYREDDADLFYDQLSRELAVLVSCLRARAASQG